MIDYKAIYSENEHVLDGLKAVQKAEGYLTKDALLEAAKAYDMAPNKVYETATFYSMLHVFSKTKHVVEVCGSTCCDAREAKELVKALEKALPETVTIRRCECLGRCDTAPNAVVDGKLLVNATCEKVAAMLGGSQ